MFSEIETIRKLEEKFLPKIVDLCKRIDAMDGKNELVKECIVKFD